MAAEKVSAEEHHAVIRAYGPAPRAGRPRRRARLLGGSDPHRGKSDSGNDTLCSQYLAV